MHRYTDAQTHAVTAMPKLKPETVRDRYAKARVAVEAAEESLSAIAAEGARFDGIYLCTSHPTGTSHGGKREKQLQHFRWQLTRKDGSNYPKGTLRYADAVEQCERGKRYAAACKQLDKARVTLAKWEEKVAALDSADTSLLDRRESNDDCKQDSVQQAA